jgi:hypothetical protein
LLACGALIYFALPRIPIHDEGIAGVFAISWLLLSLFVIAGNLTALLYTPKQAKPGKLQAANRPRKRLRQYN